MYVAGAKLGKARVGASRLVRPLLPYLYARVLVIEDFVFLENSAAAIIEVHSNLKTIKKTLNTLSVE